jgi:tight adherence protein B
MPVTVHAVLRAVAVLSLGAALPALAYGLFTDPRARLAARLIAHERELGRDLTFLRMSISPAKVARGQLLGVALSVLLALLGLVFPASLLLTGSLAVQPLLRARRARRTGELDLQLDGWLRGLASSLRATPALGEAIEHSISLVAAPLREELDTLVKELKLGIGLDEAVLRMGARVQSRTLESALATLRIGRSTGGDVSTVLERAAGTLREMARLEGVLRTKTAEGKAQTFVLALTPFPLVGLLHSLNPGFLAPLLVSTRGHLLLALALLCWISSLLLARRILRVDL